jgi:hypothetical protein
MLTYQTAFTSGGFEPFWPHFVLLSVSVFSSFAVAAGILLERPRYSETVHKVAKLLVAGGVAVVALCTIALFVFDEGISRLQQSEIIALEKSIASRPFSVDEAVKKSKELALFAGTSVDMYVFPNGTADTLPLSSSIEDMLFHASWDVANLSVATGAQYYVGVSVHVDPDASEKDKKAHDALVKALAFLGPDPDPNMRPAAGAFSSPPTRPKSPISVFVGTKPY